MPTETELRELLSALLGSRARAVEIICGQVVALVEMADMRWVLATLRDDARTQMDVLRYMTAVDRSPREPRFDVVYELYSTSLRCGVRVKYHVADTGDEEHLPEVPSMAEEYLAAIWHERECFDLMGLRFLDHPDHRRILLPDLWDGHPLRKDYPYDGKPVWKIGCTVADNVPADAILEM